MPEAIKGFGILTPLQEEFIKILASLPDKDQFYLAGGLTLVVPNHATPWICISSFKKNRPKPCSSKPRKKILVLIRTSLQLP